MPLKQKNGVPQGAHHEKNSYSCLFPSGL